MIVSLVIDQREPEWTKRLHIEGVPIATAILEIGDALIATEDNQIIVVERKTPSDLCNSIASGRLITQCAKLRDQSQWAYLVITGDLRVNQPTGKLVLDHRETGWEYASIQGALLTVQEMGVMVVHAKNDLDYLATLQRLANRDRGSVKLAPKKREALAVTPGEQMLMQLPGIGFDRMTALLKHCQTPAWALNYLTTMGNYQVPGIGEGVKRSIIKALGLQDGWELWPIQPQDDTYQGTV